MGKVRVAILGSEEETEVRRRAVARRQTKKAKKEKVEKVGLHGGERTVVMEGVELKPEIKKLVAEVEAGTEATPAVKAKRKKQKQRVRSKRYQKAAKLVDKNKTYPLSQAVDLVKKTSVTKFDGTVELSVNLNPASLGDKKDFRGSVHLPHATGRTVRVAIADEALLGKIEAGKIDFDILVAHPSLMPKLARLAKVLGPRGLMPNPKTGTVTEEPEKRAKELSSGEINFKTEPDHPILHLTIGKISFDDQKLIDNVNAYLAAVGKNKIAKATLSSTMGPGIKLAVA